MAPKPFRFKQFAVADDRCTHKVGTDGVLLGSWVNVREQDELFLDIGTGSGLIALMLAQRSLASAHIDAVEVGEADSRQAVSNVQHSPWPQKVQVWHTAIQDFFPDKQYDLIVSNPPYFVDSLHPPDKKRTAARHTERLTFPDLLEAVDRLLAPGGKFALILPFAEGKQFIAHAEKHHLYPARICAFRSRRNKPVERLLMELSWGQQSPEETELVLYGDRDAWSDAYKDLTHPWYLKA